MATLSLIPSFNSGELSPLIHLRSDLEKYRSGCRTLQNMTVTPYGGVRRRAGLAYFVTAPGKCRLFKFQASVEQAYVMEFSAGLVRFFLNETTPVFTVASPYTADDLDGIQMAQVNNVAYFTHPLRTPYKMRRVYHTLWEFAPVEFDYPAMLEENLNKSLTITTSAAGAAGASINLDSSAALFAAGHVGAHFQISHERTADQFEVTMTATSGNNGRFTAGLIVQGAWSFATSGTWSGTFVIQRSTNNGGSWQTIRQFSASANDNYSAGGTEPGQVLLRIGWTHVATGSSNPRASLEASGAFIRGLVRITSVMTSTHAEVVVVNRVRSGATSYWREGAWSGVNGYPRTVAAHEQRIIYGGNALRPSTLWGSATDDYERFEPGVDDTDSWTHALASDQQNSIQWLISQKSLLIGTSGDEWVMSSGGDETTITPSNVRARRQSGNGSDFLKARVINDAVLFVQRGGKKLRDMTFSFEADGYTTSDLTLLAEHIAGEGIIDTAYQAQPISTLWCVTRGGTLIGLTYDRAQQLVGWHRHVTGDATDGFESVTVRTTAGEADQVWVSVRRRIDGTDRRHIERICSDGFFLETPWSLLYPSTDGLELWDYRYLSSTAGTASLGPVGAPYPFFDPDWFYYCVVSHTMDETYVGTFDTHAGYSFAAPDLGQTWVWVGPWINSLSSGGYAVGDTVHHADVIYRVILHHGASGGGPGIKEPGVAVDWATYWAIVDDVPVSLPNVVVQDEYLENDEVQSGGYKYTATDDHAQTEDNEPGVGISWGSYWVRDQGTYSIGDLVSADRGNYICTADHTPSAATRPATGDDWGDVWALQPTDNLLFHVDAGVTALAFTGDEMTGLDHLEGETVQVLANGAVLSPRVVSGGAIQFDQEGDPTEFVSVTAGLAYESLLEPMALEVGMQNGTSVSREKRIYELVIYFDKTNGCQVASTTAGPFETLRFRFGDVYADQAVPLFSGAYVHKLAARHDLEASFVIKQDQPLPLTVLAVVPKWNVYGD
ncbi:hypothetical protein HQ447_16380 [bacterium]|nr:hypothetical protein [bacterium]